jgi:hypothetical protein
MSVVPSLHTPTEIDISPGAVRWDDVWHLEKESTQWPTSENVTGRWSIWFPGDSMPEFYGSAYPEVKKECERRGTDYYVHQAYFTALERGSSRYEFEGLLLPENWTREEGEEAAREVCEGYTILLSPEGSKVAYSPRYETQAKTLARYFDTLGGQFSIRFLTRDDERGELRHEKELRLAREPYRLKRQEETMEQLRSALRPAATPAVGTSWRDHLPNVLSNTAANVLAAIVVGLGALLLATIPGAWDALADALDAIRDRVGR